MAIVLSLHFPLSIKEASQGRCPCDPTGFFVLTQKSRQKKSRLRPYRSKNRAFAG
jgi:hypothetical protein